MSVRGQPSSWVAPLFIPTSCITIRWGWKEIVGVIVYFCKVPLIAFSQFNIPWHALYLFTNWIPIYFPDNITLLHCYITRRVLQLIHLFQGHSSSVQSDTGIPAVFAVLLNNVLQWTQLVVSQCFLGDKQQSTLRPVLPTPKLPPWNPPPAQVKMPSSLATLLTLWLYR